jgi:hypothetical protein
MIGDLGASGLGRMAALRWLHLQANSIGDRWACALGALTGLRVLCLGSNPVGDPDACEGLAHLQDLRVVL